MRWTDKYGRLIFDDKKKEEKEVNEKKSSSIKKIMSENIRLEIIFA